jgi:hypothetical protein
MILPQKALQGLDDLGLNEAGKASFLGGTTKRIFKL